MMREFLDLHAAAKFLSEHGFTPLMRRGRTWHWVKGCFRVIICHRHGNYKGENRAIVSTFDLAL